MKGMRECHRTKSLGRIIWIESEAARLLCFGAVTSVSVSVVTVKHGQSLHVEDEKTEDDSQQHDGAEAPCCQQLDLSANR